MKFKKNKANEKANGHREKIGACVRQVAGGGVMGEGGQKVQMSSYKWMSWKCNAQHGDYRQ